MRWSGAPRRGRLGIGLCAFTGQAVFFPVRGQRSGSMADGAICSKCGSAVPGDAPQGLCPACLLAFALDDEPADPAPGGPGDASRQDPSHAGAETIAVGPLTSTTSATMSTQA